MYTSESDRKRKRKSKKSIRERERERQKRKKKGFKMKLKKCPLESFGEKKPLMRNLLKFPENSVHNHIKLFTSSIFHS